MKRLAILAVLMMAGAAWAKTVYMRTDGSDLNDGSANDAAHAVATFAGVQSVIGSGDTVLIEPGTYNMSDPGDGLTSFTGLDLTGVDNVTIQGVGSPTINCVLTDAYWSSVNTNQDNISFIKCCSTCSLKLFTLNFVSATPANSRQVTELVRAIDAQGSQSTPYESLTMLSVNVTCDDIAVEGAWVKTLSVSGGTITGSEYGIKSWNMTGGRVPAITWGGQYVATITSARVYATGWTYCSGDAITLQGYDGTITNTLASTNLPAATVSANGAYGIYIGGVSAINCGTNHDVGNIAVTGCRAYAVNNRTPTTATGFAANGLYVGSNATVRLATTKCLASTDLTEGLLPDLYDITVTDTLNNVGGGMVIADVYSVSHCAGLVQGNVVDLTAYLIGTPSTTLAADVAEVKADTAKISTKTLTVAVTSEGSVVASATVQVATDEAAANVIASGTTDASGTVIINVSAGGRFWLKVSKNGYVTSITPFIKDAARGASVSVSLAGA